MTERPDDEIHLETDEQLRAMASVVRHRIVRVLRDGPATITQIAERLGIAKGSSNHHVKILARAGVVHVAETRKVRGVTEQYYAISAKRIFLPESPDGRETLMRHALADIEAAPPDDQRTVFLKHVRLSREQWDVFDAKLKALYAELAAADDPAQAPADLFVAFYRPKDLRDQ